MKTTKHNTFNLLPLPDNNESKKQQWQWGLCPNRVSAYQVAADYLAHPHRLVVCVMPNNQQIEYACKVSAFLGVPNEHLHALPDSEVLPYDLCAPAQSLIAQRISVLSALPKLKQGLVFVSEQSLFERFAPKSILTQNHQAWHVGQSIDHDKLIQSLVDQGYRRVSTVEEHGEFAVRGSIIDCFMSGMDHPIRLDVFDDTIDALRLFDVDSQRTIEKIEQLNCLPADPLALNESMIDLFRKQWREAFGVSHTCPMYDAISDGEKLAGSEHYLPLFFERTDTFFDYCPEQATFIFSHKLKENLSTYEKVIHKRYEQYRYDKDRPLLAPDVLFQTTEVICQQLKQHHQIALYAASVREQTGHWNCDYASLGFSPSPVDAKDPFKDFLIWQDAFAGNIILVAESNGRATILYDQLKRRLPDLAVYPNWAEAYNAAKAIAIVIGPIEDGFCLEHFAIITENDLFASHVAQARKQQASTTDPTLRIRSLSELNKGDLVVHRQHGIGQYCGLENLTTGDIHAEYMLLQYANDDKIYVPITQLDAISRFLTANTSHALNQLGKGQWQKQKQKAIRQIRDIASELLKLYSERKRKQGVSIESPEKDYQQFSAGFAYGETPDQDKAIAATIEDLKKPQPMDRLVCGDVGFGKTEIALRAAFVAAQAGKQVAFIAPTTLLAKQHADTFKARFADWPIHVAGISRFNNSKEQKAIIEGLADGTVDIVIGTHRLLSKDVQFKDLGLVIIDEEHRFGVAQKEKMTHLKNNVDILSLTATPIPRSLNMAFEGLRDISIIATPPENRLNIKTFFREYNMAMIKEAIERERMRGGQVYFVHNDIATLQAQADALQDALPNCRIAVAHGQTPKKQLQRIMLDFYHQRIHVLVCTTIVESGLDVPTANTIIINKADRLGLAQLHQLRGRVGRSHHQAYAYMMVPSKRTLTTDSKRRLEAMTTINSLGAGFDLANQDLEIRGAGELLGAEQSGHIHSIGYTLYMDLLQEAIQCFEKGEKFEPKEDKEELTIDVGVSCLFPESYIGDVGTRLGLYKRLSDMTDSKTIQNFQAEMIDRFGPLPLEAQQLMDTALLRLTCQAMDINSVTCGTQYLAIHFDEGAKINVDALLTLIQKATKTYRMKDNQTLQVRLDADKTMRLSQLQNSLDALKLKS